MPLPTDLVTTNQVANHLNWSTDEQFRLADEMSTFISAATSSIEQITGPVVQRQFDEWYSGGSQRIQLDNYPVVSVASITESYGSNTIWTLTEQPLDGSVAYDSYGYTLDKASGLLIRRYSGTAARFAAGERNVHIIYTAGMCTSTNTVPPNVVLATLELIRVNWQPQQGGNRPGYGNNGAGGIDALPVASGPFTGFFMPNRVIEILRPATNRFAIG